MVEKQGQKINEENRPHVLVNGKDRNYWEDISIYTKYNNCSEFIYQIKQMYGHIETNSRWQGDIVNPSKAKSEENGFINWLRGELSHPELRKCFDKTNDKGILDLKARYGKI